MNSLISRRWSPYIFNAAKRVEAEKLSKCVEAARWAPSCYNEQPWHIVYADKFEQPEAHARFLALMVEFNAGWAESAPVLGIVAHREESLILQKRNSHADYDCGAAMALFCLQATELGLQVHQMAGFDPVRADAELCLPEGFKSLTIFAMGYEAEDLTGASELYLERHEKQRIRVRKDPHKVASPAEFN